MSNRPVHFEIPADDPEKTMKFFTEVFNWNFQEYMPGEYWMAHTGDDNSDGIHGAIMKKRDPNQPITNAIDVADIDASMRAIEAAGGQIVVPKIAVPTMGWNAYFKDPDGNIHGLWQNDPNAA